MIYNNNSAEFEKFCSMIELYPINIIVDKASSYNDIIYLTKQNQYEKIFVDYDDIGKKIVNQILKKNPKQKIFLMNENFECPMEKDCYTCRKKYQKNIIIKPLCQNQLTKILSRKFTCESENLSHKEFTLEKIKKKVQQKYPYLTFDYCKDRDSFLSNNISTSALVYVTDLLNKHQIEFQVTHKNQILIN
ncbi:hypothetical protein CP965_13225 [Halarcobacter mediterraneus]|uniref:Response regulatory domain-containing protein n=1 Tax=Halarcobacter mediterraneus TaxID=2023153 RepID=A0A4V1M108_9BACT|nr:hypothetical protein [Halarcobacter mediterraneus]RXK11724.1 hypothetical protein CP965_13225 [Halarcobacter mediterraneus]